MNKKLLLAFCCSCGLLAGCQSTLYDWGDYDQNLYNYYQNPLLGDEFSQDLNNHVSTLIIQKKTIPPGLLAEIGTFHLQKGNLNEAIEFYDKESKCWPESKLFMDKLVTTLKKNAKKTNP